MNITQTPRSSETPARVRAGSGERRLDWLAWVLVALATAALGARRRRPAIVLLITSAMTAVTVSLGYPLGLIWLAPLIALYARGPGDPGPTRRGRARPAARPADGRLADGDRPGPRRPGGAGAGRYPERRANPHRGAGAGRGRPGGDGGLPGPGAGRVHRGCPAGPGWRRDGTALVSVLPAAETSTDAGRVTVERVRGAAAALPGVQVGGTGALDIDATHAVYGAFPLMLAVVALATFVLLARAFRSLLLPAKAVVLNLLSIGAAYGVLVLVWQHGHGSSAVWGIDATGAIVPWVPLMTFAFLYGLSMDYEVFLLARMREAYDATGSTQTAVVQGLGHVGRLVTSAALILFLAFAALASVPAVGVKIMATGLGAGILLDATVLRALLMPAAVVLLGRWNWWLPTWTARVLRLPPTPAGQAAGPQP